MTVHELAEFVGVSAVVIVTPGQDTALTIRNTLTGGRRGGVVTACGVISGQLTWALATSVGLAALLLASQSGFVALKVVGAAYLAYLGLRGLLAAWRLRESSTAGPAPRSFPLPTLTAYRQGLLSNLGNPKIAVFFTSLLPQFAGRHASFLALVALGALFAAMTLIWLTGYAFAVAKAGDFLRRPPIRRAIDASSGLVLLGLGLRLAREHR
jgi:threonine/homoserine/homoserine lactone efflux protein